MKVALDVSTMGAMFGSAFHGGGIVRVIQALGWELERMPGLDLSYVTMSRRCIYHRSLEQIRTVGVLESQRLGKAGIRHSAYMILDRLASRRPGAARRGLRAKCFSPLRSAVDAGFPVGLGRIPPEVYHAPFEPVPDAVRRRGVASVRTVYDLIPLRHPEYCDPIFAAYFRDVILPGFRPGDYIHAISEYTRRDLLEARPDLDPDRVVTIPLAAGPHFRRIEDRTRLESLRRGLGLAKADRFILVVNTLEARKNIDAAVAAFADAVAAGLDQNVHLILAGGSGWKMERLERELESHPELKGRIHLPGYVPEEDLPALYSAAELFLFPSLCEGFGLPPLEAMACGTPVVCSNRTSLPEVVADAGILVDPTDIRGMSEAIRSVLADPDLRSRLSTASLRRAGEFSWERTTKELISLYGRAATQSRQPK